MPPAAVTLHTGRGVSSGTRDPAPRALSGRFRCSFWTPHCGFSTQTMRHGFPSRPARAVEGLLAHFTFPSTGFLVGYGTPFPRNPEGECSKEPWNPPVPGCYLSTCPAGVGSGCPSCLTHQTGLPSSHRALLHGRGTCASSRPLVSLYFI